jgi:hypothetical protein
MAAVVKLDNGARIKASAYVRLYREGGQKEPKAPKVYSEETTPRRPPLTWNTHLRPVEGVALGPLSRAALGLAGLAIVALLGAAALLSILHPWR